MSHHVLAHEDQGRGPAVVLLHAFPCDRRMWRAQAEVLVGAGWRVIRPDLAGFGESTTHAKDAPSLDRMAADVLRLMDRLGVDDFVLGGLSMGGYVSMALLRQDSERVRGLILADTKATADAPEAQQVREAAAATVLAAGSTAPVSDAMLTGLLGATTRETRPGVVDVVSGWVGEARPEAFAWAQRAMARRPDSHPDLAAFDRPSLVLWGEEDTLTPPAGHESMLAALPDVTDVGIPGAGHLSAVEDPGAVSAALLAFLTQLPGSSG